MYERRIKVAAAMVASAEMIRFEAPDAARPIMATAVANTYDGCMIDEDYNLLGVVQVKTAKQSGMAQ